MSAALSKRPRGYPLGQAALVSGILAVLAFFGLGFTVGDWWFVVGAALGLVAIVLGAQARRESHTAGERRRAVIGLVLGGVPAVWFVAYTIVAAIF